MISPLDIATDGYLCSPLSVVVNGYLCTVETEIVPPDKIPPKQIISIAGGGGNRLPFRDWERKKENKNKKLNKITVKVKVDGKEYIQTEYVDDLTIKAEDVKFEITDDKPNIKIKISF